MAPDNDAIAAELARLKAQAPPVYCSESPPCRDGMRTGHENELTGEIEWVDGLAPRPLCAECPRKDTGIRTIEVRSVKPWHYAEGSEAREEAQRRYEERLAKLREEAILKPLDARLDEALGEASKRKRKRPRRRR